MFERTREHYEALGVTDWMVYHDALQQMIDEKCREWMREKGYYDRWVVPLHGLNEVIYGKGKNGQKSYSKRFGKRPPGDTPELVALDSHLNKDVKDCAMTHDRALE